MASLPIVLAILAHAALISGHEKGGAVAAGGAVVCSLLLWILETVRWLEGKKGDQGPA